MVTNEDIERWEEEERVHEEFCASLPDWMEWLD